MPLLSVPCQATAKFGICTVVSLNGTLVEIKMFTFNLDCTHFIFNECPIIIWTQIQHLLRRNGLQCAVCTVQANKYLLQDLKEK